MSTVPRGINAMTTVLVPLCELGLGTGRAAVLDARTGKARWFHLPDGVFTLDGCTACVWLRSDAAEGGLHRVLLPGGGSCWCRVREEGRAAA